MRIHDILLEHGLFSQDIRAKVKNGQIKLNGETVTDSTIELDIVFDKDDKNFKFEEFGDFIFKLLMKGGLSRELLLGSLDAGLDIEELSETNIDNKLTNVFKKVHVMRLSRREAIILIKK